LNKQVTKKQIALQSWVKMNYEETLNKVELFMDKSGKEKNKKKIGGDYEMFKMWGQRDTYKTSTRYPS